MGACEVGMKHDSRKRSFCILIVHTIWQKIISKDINDAQMVLRGNGRNVTDLISLLKCAMQ